MNDGFYTSQPYFSGNAMFQYDENCESYARTGFFESLRNFFHTRAAANQITAEPEVESPVLYLIDNEVVRQAA